MLIFVIISAAMQDIYRKSDVASFTIDNEDMIVRDDVAISHDRVASYRADGSVVLKGKYVLLRLRIFIWHIWIIKLHIARA